MTKESEIQPWWSSFWLGGAGTLIAISVGFVLKQWLPFHFAIGIGGFVGWFVGGLISTRWAPPRYGMPVWLAALIIGTVTGLCVGILSYYFPW